MRFQILYKQLFEVWEIKFLFFCQEQGRKGRMQNQIKLYQILEEKAVYYKNSSVAQQLAFCSIVSELNLLQLFAG